MEKEYIELLNKMTEAIETQVKVSQELYSKMKCLEERLEALEWRTLNKWRTLNTKEI